MNSEHFDDLLALARAHAHAHAHAQAEPQCLLMVFVAAEIEPDATPSQRAAFEAGQGGVLRPLVCVDKDPVDLTDFAALAVEARHAGPAWSLMFAAALAGSTSPKEVERMLEVLVKRVETGELAGLIHFNPAGETVQLAA
jgi:hypothetical protein